MELKIIETHAIENIKMFKTHLGNRKEKHKPWNMNNQLLFCGSLTLVHSENIKHSGYILYFTNSTVKANSSFT